MEMILSLYALKEESQIFIYKKKIFLLLKL